MPHRSVSVLSVGISSMSFSTADHSMPLMTPHARMRAKSCWVWVGCAGGGPGSAGGGEDSACSVACAPAACCFVNSTVGTRRKFTAVCACQHAAVKTVEIVGGDHGAEKRLIGCVELGPHAGPFPRTGCCG